MPSAYMLFALWYALLSGPLAAAGLICSCFGMAMQTKRRFTYTDNSSGGTRYSDTRYSDAVSRLVTSC